ncbi:hypothetical protein L9F63_004206 [Diploptera punctata]|uniref:Phosphatidylethanolamine-binding protein n=1 Tax=Diploptera punctata TaxID=6984 RepID=A0AAD7ZHS0_DIPPU|nr:hypothetical protein L9F63_004206 [Diploptera punctata]
MEESQIIPDIIERAPPQELQVSYGRLKVHLGNELTPTQVKAKPTVHWNAEHYAFYVLSMTDPDVPSRDDHEWREFSHWMVGNILGDKINNGEVITEYVGAGPLNGTGLHRYVFMVFKQPGKINFTEPHADKNTLDGRPQFSTKEFAERYNLGDPIAGNFFQAKYDDYVPTIHEQLGTDLEKK